MLSEEKLNKILKTLGKTESDLIDDLKKLISARNKLVSFSSSIIPDFYYGSLVLDNRHNEIGILIGPLDVYGKDKEKEYVVTRVTEGENIRKERLKTYLVVTLTNNIADSESISTSAQFRVRYLNGNYITPLNIEESRMPVDDLENFCNNQCIMDCQDSCSLWKYRKKKQ